MNQQSSFAQEEYARKKKSTRREKFRAQMEAVVPWARLEAVIALHYPVGRRGRPPVGLERMLRLYFFSRKGMRSLPRRSRTRSTTTKRGALSRAATSAAKPCRMATTRLKFRHRFERHDLGRHLFEEVGAMLEEKQLLMREGTLLAATLLAAPSSTKNARRARAIVEPPFHIVKNIFRHRKARYRGLEKNTAQLRVPLALANLYPVRRQLSAAAAA